MVSDAGSLVAAAPARAIYSQEVATPKGPQQLLPRHVLFQPLLEGGPAIAQRRVAAHPLPGPRLQRPDPPFQFAVGKLLSALWSEDHRPVARLEAQALQRGE